MLVLTNGISFNENWASRLCSAIVMGLGGRNTRQVPDRSWNMEFTTNTHLLRPSLVTRAFTLPCKARSLIKAYLRAF